MLSASGASISGSITATSGKIGGCELENGVLKVARVNIKDNAVGWNEIEAECIDSDLIVKGSITAECLAVTYLTAESATITNIEASIATVAGITGKLGVAGRLEVCDMQGKTIGYVEGSNYKLVVMNTDD